MESLPFITLVVNYFPVKVAQRCHHDRLDTAQSMLINVIASFRFKAVPLLRRSCLAVLLAILVTVILH